MKILLITFCFVIPCITFSQNLNEIYLDQQDTISIETYKSKKSAILVLPTNENTTVWKVQVLADDGEILLESEEKKNRFQIAKYVAKAKHFGRIRIYSDKKQYFLHFKD